MDKNLKEIYDQIVQIAKSEVSKASSKDRWGTATTKSTDGKVEVMLDGGETATPCDTVSTVYPGDRVLLNVTPERTAVVKGNYSKPSATDADLVVVRDTATEAAELLSDMNDAAIAAGTTLEDIYEDAKTASTLVTSMKTAADSAGKTLAQIVSDADESGTLLAGMQDAATAAGTTLEGIYADAESAKSSATQAARGLSEVERVVGAASWIAEHAAYVLTTDAAVDPASVYYTLSGGTYAPTTDTEIHPHKQYYALSSGEYAPVRTPVAADLASYYERSGMTPSVVEEPTAEGLSGYFELYVGESVQNYVNTHLWVDDNGLNVASDNDETGGKAVRTGWRIGSVFEMVRDGLSWFKLWVESNAAKLRLGLETSGHILLDADGMEILDYDATARTANSVANFGKSGARIGKPFIQGASDNEARAEIDYHSLQLIDCDNESYLHVSDLRDSQDTQPYIGTERYLSLLQWLPDYTFPCLIDVFSVEAHNQGGAYDDTDSWEITLVDKDAGTTIITRKGNYSLDTDVTFTAIATPSGFKAFTFGTRAEDRVGYSSATLGELNKASGHFSLAAGKNANATDFASCSLNEGTVAIERAQTAIGMYNEPCTDKAVVIGCGYSDDDRSTAATIDWDGNYLSRAMAGVIQMFAGTSPPAGWLVCDGSAVSRADYALLFAAIGTAWGAGDGSTTFNLPDMRGRFPVGFGPNSANNNTYWGSTPASTVNNALGERGGEAWHTLTTDQIPAHHHSMGNLWSSGSGSSAAYMTTGSRGLMTRQTADTGGGSRHNNMPPYATVNFIICTGKTS